MTYIQKICYLLLLFHFWGMSSMAQNNDTRIKDVLYKVQAAYKNVAYLSFTVHYAYANRDNLIQPVDTMDGVVQMNGQRSHVSLSGIETLVTDQYSIQVLPQDKLLYVSSAPSPSVMDPVGSVDSVLPYLDKFRTSLTEEGGNDVLMIYFPTGGRFTQVRMMVDDKTGFLKEMVYSLSTSGLVTNDQLKASGKGGAYQAQGQVSIRFSDYRRGAFGDSVFDLGNYLTKRDGHYVPSKSYDGYQIFWAKSPQ